MEINLKQEISLKHFEEIIVTALECGSNYWYLIKISDFSSKLSSGGGETLSMRIALSLFQNMEFKLPVYDKENEDELLGIVTQSSMLEALEIAHKDYSHHYYDLMEGQGDADTADIIFQLAVMKEIIFG